MDTRKTAARNALYAASDACNAILATIEAAEIARREYETSDQQASEAYAKVIAQMYELHYRLIDIAVSNMTGRTTPDQHEKN